MSEYMFNVDNGYLEALVRGFRSGILSRADYINLVQCETVEGESILTLINISLVAIIRLSKRIFTPLQILRSNYRPLIMAIFFKMSQALFLSV